MADILGKYPDLIEGFSEFVSHCENIGKIIILLFVLKLCPAFSFFAFAIFFYPSDCIRLIIFFDNFPQMDFSRE